MKNSKKIYDEIVKKYKKKKVCELCENRSFKSFVSRKISRNNNNNIDEDLFNLLCSAISLQNRYSTHIKVLSSVASCYAHNE